jgi:Phosphotransferase enzyme family
VNLSFADPLYLLPAPARTAAVGPGAEGWRELFGRTRLQDAVAAAPQVLVTGARLRAADTQDAAAIILEGDESVDGYVSRRYVVFGSREQPILLVPRDSENVLTYALSTWSSPQTRVGRLRSSAAARLPRLATRLAGWPEVTVATRNGGVPYVVAAALEQLSHAEPVDWFLVCGQSDDLGRVAFVLFPHGADRPRWIVKFARVPGYSEPFDREERAFAAVAAAGGAAATHAPRFEGRFEVDGLAASIESAAVGRRLSSLLRSTGSRSAKLRIVQAVAEWIVTLGTETRRTEVGPELDRLRDEVLPAWPDAPSDLLAGLAEVPLVLQHNDLGIWNLVGDASGFTAVDWEDANPAGLPLWDLWYFLADALCLLDRGGDSPEAFTRLFRGDAPGSAELFRWTRTAVEALAVPPETVGRLATLCWLHHGLSHVARGDAIDRYAPGGGTSTPVAAAYARAWLADPALGSTWSRWA